MLHARADSLHPRPGALCPNLPRGPQMRRAWRESEAQTQRTARESLFPTVSRCGPARSVRGEVPLQTVSCQLQYGPLRFELSDD